MLSARGASRQHARSLALARSLFGVARALRSLLSPCSHLLKPHLASSRAPRPASRVPHPAPSSIAPRRQRHVLERERLLVQNWRLAVTRELPRRNVGEAVVVSQRFAIGRLMLDTKVRATGLLSIQRVDTHQLGELEKIRDASGALELLVQLLARAGHVQIAPELLAKLRYQLQRLAQSFGVSRHAAVLPHDLSQLAMERCRRALSADGRQAPRPLAHRSKRRAHVLMILAHGLRLRRREVVADCEWNDEVPIGESLHQRARAEPVGAMVREVRLADDV